MSRSATETNVRLQAFVRRERAYAQAVKGYAVGMFKRLKANRKLMGCPVTLVDRFVGEVPPEEYDEWARDLSLWAGRFGLDCILVPQAENPDPPFRPPVGGASLIPSRSQEHQGCEVLLVDDSGKAGAPAQEPGTAKPGNPSLAEVLGEASAGGAFPIVIRGRGIREEALESASWPERPIGIEVVSGAGKLYECFDAQALRGVSIWDRMLKEGKRVLGLAFSDAEHPWSFSTAFTGLIGSGIEPDGPAKALSAGRMFVSNGPFVETHVNGAPMGGVTPRAGKRVEINVRAADVRGLLFIRCVAGGETVREFEGKGQKDLDIGFLAPVPTHPVGVRCETVTMDGRRAISNPVFVL